MSSLIQRLRSILAGTLRRQLILGVALVHAVLMTLFVLDLTDRQRDLLLERQTEQAKALARSVATSAAGWVASRDLYGLQEIITAQSRYPELLFAMILDREGKVLAHSDTSYLGQYLKDMPSSSESTILTRSPELVDAVNPVILASQSIGWVRIGLGQEGTAASLATITRNGIFYAIAAIAIGSLLAWYMGTQLTRKLRIIQESADAVEQGDLNHRVDIGGRDEVSHVAHAFNKMLDSVVSSHQKLERSEERFNLAMHATNDGLWDWDLLDDFVYYSPRWKEMLGYQEDELEDSFITWERLVDRDDKQKTMTLIEACLAGKMEGFEAEFKMRHKNGHWIQILSRGALICDEYDEPVRIVGTHVDITDKKQREAVIWHQANYDALTSLPNRKLFLELLEQEIKKANRDRHQLWIFFLDLDGFKEVNDSFGHQLGDKLLILVGERIQEVLREADIVARLGGDEYVLVLSRIDKQNDIDNISSKLVNAIAQKFEVGQHEIFVSASIGIANYPNDAKNAIDLLKFSDQSMYEAKKEGKNRYSYFTSALQQASQLRMQIMTDLRQAISNNEFELYYQPIIKLDDGEMHKAEALIRWQHSEKGLINPAAFIPIAEETGIICEIGIWVIENALKQLKDWQPVIGNDFQLSINMSPSQLKVKDKKYDDWVRDLGAQNIPGENIVVEITEGLLLKSEKNITDRLLQYRDAGVQIAIDDFGTGYSSLAYLKEFDIDYLKIDKSFVRNLQPGNSEESLCEAIIVMAHKLDLKVIAEGIETEQQLELLKKMGCDFGQGYYFSRPLTIRDFERNYICSAKKIAN